MIELNLAIIGLILSIIFSSSEIALITSNKLQINVWIKQNYRLSTTAKKILDQKSIFLIVCLIGTNLSNILASSFATAYLIKTNIISTELIFIPIAAIILLFGEILPKTIIKEYSNLMLLVLSPFLWISYILLFPFVKLLDIFNLSKNKLFIKNKREILNAKRKEFESVFDQNDENDSMEANEKEIITNIFEYSKITVHEAMTPRTEISAISSQSSLDEAAHAFIDSGHSKLPVYDGNIDNIVGIIYIYDLYSKPESLKDIIKEIMFIPFSKLVSNLLQEFKEKNQSIAVVLDEHGGTSGLITNEDVFEELFGDFQDEFDYDEIDISENEDGSFLINARVECEIFNLKFGNIIKDGDYETVGGYIINEIGRIPNKNEHLFTSIGHIVIKKGSSRRIEQIQYYKP